MFAFIASHKTSLQSLSRALVAGVRLQFIYFFSFPINRFDDCLLPTTVLRSVAADTQASSILQCTYSAFSCKKKKTSFFFTFDVLSGVISWKQSRQISFPAWVAPKETNIFAPGVWAPLVLMGWSHWHWDWMARDVLDVTSRDEKGCRAPDKLNLLGSVYLTNIYMSAFEANITHSLLQWYDRTMPFWKHDWLAEGNPTIACIKWKDVFRPSLSATNCPASRILLFLKL